jgi:thiamine biosynthesis lipoprotein
MVAIGLRQFSFNAMSCKMEVQLFGSAAAAETAFQTVVAETQRIEAKYSRYRPDSLIGRINRSAGREAVSVDEETAGLLDFAAVSHQASGGLFDITSGALRQVWKFDSGRLPSQAQIVAARARVGWHKLRWQSPSIYLPEAGMEIDFGGLGKEYAADRAAALLMAQGFTSALVNFGGDVCATGPRPDGSPWHIGIHHPRKAGQLLATLPLYRGGLATSGDYERNMIVAGQRYGHLLNPLTGWPAQGMASVTTIADTCLVAGSLASIAMVHGQEGMAFLAGCGAPYLALAANGHVVASAVDSLSTPDTPVKLDLPRHYTP